MVETLSNLLRSVVALSPPDLLPILYLSLNRLGPPQQGLELGVGDGVLLKAVAQATGKQGVWWQLLREEALREKVQRWRGCERWQRGTSVPLKVGAWVLVQVREALCLGWEEGLGR